MSQYTAFLDSNVIYSAPLRDILVQLAVADLFRAKWSADVHREWMGKLLENEPQIDRARLERTRDLMDMHTRDCLVRGYGSLIPGLKLPDPDDRHILAAAIVGRCDVIVTKNLRDFPAETLAEYGIEAQHPDEFLVNQLNLAPGLFCRVVRRVRGRMQNPPRTVAQYLTMLTQQELVGTVAELQQFAELI